MADYLLGSWVPFLLLMTVAVAFGIVLLVVQRWGNRISWPWVDPLWVESNAATLAFIGIGILNDASQAQGQIELNNYLQHDNRGRDRASDNLDTYCIGSPGRRAEVTVGDIADIENDAVLSGGFGRDRRGNDLDAGCVGDGLVVVVALRRLGNDIMGSRIQSAEGVPSTIKS